MSIQTYEHCTAQYIINKNVNQYKLIKWASWRYYIDVYRWVPLIHTHTAMYEQTESRSRKRGKEKENVKQEMKPTNDFAVDKKTAKTVKRQKKKRMEENAKLKWGRKLMAWHTIGCFVFGSLLASTQHKPLTLQVYRYMYICAHWNDPPCVSVCFILSFSVLCVVTLIRLYRRTHIYIFA